MMIRGVIIFGVGISLVLIALNAVSNWIESRPSPTEQKFVVVDTYKDCDVVEYRPDYSARYYYFLHCK